MRLPGLLLTVVLAASGCGDRQTPEPDAEAAAAEPAPDSIRTFSSFDGTRIAFRDSGSGRPVILLHGFVGTSEFWRGTALVDSLRAAGWRVIRPDLRGNGASDHPHDPAAWAGDVEVGDLSALADHLGLARFDAVGYSRGSIVLAKWLTMESRIDRAVLGGMGIDFSDPEWDRRRLFADLFSGRIAPDSLTEGAMEYARAAGADLVSLGLQQEFQPVTSVAELGRIDRPILILAGADDSDNGSPDDLAAAIPGGELRRVPGDHMSTYGSGAFAGAVMGFLRVGR